MGLKYIFRTISRIKLRKTSHGFDISTPEANTDPNCPSASTSSGRESVQQLDPGDASISTNKAVPQVVPELIAFENLMPAAPQRAVIREGFPGHLSVSSHTASPKKSINAHTAFEEAMSTLKFVKRLPLEELRSVGAGLTWGPTSSTASDRTESLSDVEDEEACTQSSNATQGSVRNCDGCSICEMEIAPVPFKGSDGQDSGAVASDMDADRDRWWMDDVEIGPFPRRNDRAVDTASISDTSPLGEFKIAPFPRPNGRVVDDDSDSDTESLSNYGIAPLPRPKAHNLETVSFSSLSNFEISPLPRPNARFSFSDTSSQRNFTIAPLPRPNDRSVDVNSDSDTESLSNCGIAPLPRPKPILDVGSSPHTRSLSNFGAPPLRRKKARLSSFSKMSTQRNFTIAPLPRPNAQYLDDTTSYSSSTYDSDSDLPHTFTLHPNAQISPNNLSSHTTTSPTSLSASLSTPTRITALHSLASKALSGDLTARCRFFYIHSQIHIQCPDLEHASCGCTLWTVGEYSFRAPDLLTEEISIVRRVQVIERVKSLEVWGRVTGEEVGVVIMQLFPGMDGDGRQGMTSTVFRIWVEKKRVENIFDEGLARELIELQPTFEYWNSMDKTSAQGSTRGMDSLTSQTTDEAFYALPEYSDVEDDPEYNRDWRKRGWGAFAASCETLCSTHSVRTTLAPQREAISGGSRWRRVKKGYHDFKKGIVWVGSKMGRGK